jgi:hypothetical protein
MSVFEHSPWPWKVDMGGNIEDANGEYLGCIIALRDEPLVTRAPLLLAAGQQLYEALRRSYDHAIPSATVIAQVKEAAHAWREAVGEPHG